MYFHSNRISTLVLCKRFAIFIRSIYEYIQGQVLCYPLFYCFAYQCNSHNNNGNINFYYKDHSNANFAMGAINDKNTELAVL